jgi:hypothetical protein
MGKRGPHPIADRALLLTTAYPIYCDFWALTKGERRGVTRRGGSVSVGANLPPELDTVLALLNAETESEVRKACRNSAWMAKQPASYLCRVLPIFAGHLLEAKMDPHYPQSERVSSVRKRFWFLARCLAGAMYGLSPRRSLNVIGPGEPEKIFDSLSSDYTVVRSPSSDSKPPSKKRRRRE